MKNFKKMMALVIAMVMVLGMTTMSVVADSSLTSDGSIEVSGIDEGDTVTLYKIVKWTPNVGWELDHSITGITVDDLTVNANNNANYVTADEAALICAAPGTAIAGPTAVGSNGTFTTTVDPGLYLVLITDVNNDTVYNPVFVSSDWDPQNNTNVIDITGKKLDATPNAIAKKEDLTLTKEIDTSATPFTDNNGEKNTVAPGDVVPFVVTSAVPTYADNYTDPVFTISDALSDGITMTAAQQAAITVTVTGYNLINKADSENDEWDYEFKNVTGKGYTVSFNESFLKKVTGSPAVTIHYSATIDELPENGTLDNVERFRNEATLVFSNNPVDQNSHGTRDDETNHYTFSIDANLNGSNSGGEVTKELVKVGVDEGGEVVTAWTTSDETKWSTITPIEGAVFKLVSKTTNKEYTATSDGDGYIHFYGLDAGEYTLTEESAPTGYIKDSSTHTVVITPTWNTVTDESDGSTHTTLKDYTVTVDGKNNSKYTITNDSESEEITEVVADSTNITTPFTNFKGTTLPSTGGIGTTIFYIVGVILVLGAGIVLVTRRRMSAN